MNVRSASFRDLARVEQLYRDSLAGEDAAHEPLADSPVPQATLLRLWYALGKTLSALVPPTDSADVLHVAEHETEGIVGFIQAQGAARPAVWQIVNFCVAPTGAGHFARERLLTHLCNVGLEQGVTRFNVRLPIDHPLVSVFLEHGFTQFATEQILFHDNPEQITLQQAGSSLPVRSARREDAGPIYLLYQRVTPSHIASFEATSLKTWQASFAQGAVARIGRDDTRHVVVENPGVVGWCAIRPAAAGRPTTLSLMCETHDPSVREGFVDAILADLPPQPVFCVLRHYDSELIRSLQQRGFAVFGTQLLLVRNLGTKVRVRSPARRKKPVLAHAGMAGSHVSAPSLTVLHPHERRER